MPPRARKKAAPKPAQEESTVTEVTETEAPPVEETEQPKRRPGRKRSELAHAARDYEQADDAVQRLEGQYQKLATKLSEVGAKLAKARETRDTAWNVIETARNARVAPDVVDPSTVDDDGDDE